jgi:ABC-type sulfate/molybdate transport systems ATPase subunit
MPEPTNQPRSQLTNQPKGQPTNQLRSGPGLDVNIRTHVGALELVVHLSVSDAVLALVGPNGAGKSTALLCALGIHRPSAGRIALGDRVLFDAARRIDVPIEERGFGYVPQHYALFPHLSALDNVAFALACTRVRPRLPRRERRERARATLRALGVEHVADRLPATLSGGEAQRIALARALVTEPVALLLDEPFAALDVRARPAMRELLRAELAALGRPAIIVTHDVDDAAALAARIAVMEHGRIVQIETLDALRARPATPFVAELTGGRPPADPVVIPVERNLP